MSRPSAKRVYGYGFISCTALFPDGASYAVVVLQRGGDPRQITDHTGKNKDVPPGTVLVDFGDELFATLPEYDDALELAKAKKHGYIHLPDGFEHTVTVDI